VKKTADLLMAEGQYPNFILRNIKDAPESGEILKRFGELVFSI